MRYLSITFIILCLLFSVLLLNSCRKTGIEDFSDSLGVQREVSEQSLDADEDIQTENGESTVKPGNDIMFHNNEANFAFIYPQEYLTISSYPDWSGDYGDLSLNVSINAIENLKGSEKESAKSKRDSLNNT